MNKAELIEHAADEAGITKKAMGEAIDAIQSTIKVAVARGEEVRFAGLFNLSVEHKPTHTGRNPATGAAVVVSAKNAIKIKPAKELINAANGL